MGAAAIKDPVLRREHRDRARRLARRVEAEMKRRRTGETMTVRMRRPTRRFSRRLR
jgi:hypothetical protein